MLQTEQLYELIQSLSASEKRAFKLQASLQNGSKNYLALFDILDEMEFFEEEGVPQEIAVRGLDMNYSGTQSYLYQKILDALCSVNEKELIDAKINKLMLEAEILKKRGFFKLSTHTLEKASKIAEKHHRNGKYLEILKKKALNITNYYTKKRCYTILLGQITKISFLQILQKLVVLNFNTIRN